MAFIKIKHRNYAIHANIIFRMKTKVLIGIVTAQAKDYCFERFCQGLDRITYPADIMFVDNSEDPKHVKMIQKKYPAVRLRTGNNLYEIMANCNEYLQQKALSEGYTHFLSLESDIIPHNDFLEYLLAWRKPVIGLPYFIGQSVLSYLLQFDYKTFAMEKSVFPMSPMKSFHEFKGKPKKALQIGIGCLLIRRDVLIRLRFKLDPRYPQFHLDTTIHLQLQEMGVPVYLAQNYIPTHLNQSWNKIYNK